ncbi:MAG: acyloxyacyl hydrolase [Bacteroidetes bacterium]|nr:acyloxyacyl hydrolase [Bacteroidota bacterium]
MNKKIIFFLFFSWILQNPCQSQNKLFNNLYASSEASLGFVLPEYKFVNSITNDYSRGIGLSISHKSKGKSEVEQWFNYPEKGVSLFHATLGNDKVFGKETALFYFFKLYLAPPKRVRLFNHMGIGLSYVTKKFDLISNPFNVAVGSHVNIHFNYRFGLNVALSKNWETNIGLSFNHLSNANTREPNLGLNYFTSFFGLSHKLGEQDPYKKYERKKHQPINLITGVLGFGGKHTRLLATASDYYLTTSFSMDFERSFFRKFRFGIGPDFFYDTSVKSSLDKNEYKPSDSFQTGIHFSQTIFYNRFSVTIQEGFYLFFTEKVGEYPMYNRGILQYKITDHLAFRFAMKSHIYILDFPELGFCYQFK